MQLVVSWRLLIVKSAQGYLPTVISNNNKDKAKFDV